MPDKIEKALQRLSKKEKKRISETLLAIKVGSFDKFDILKLKGKDDIYRVRKGRIRIIFRKEKEAIIILAIERRSDTTYN